MLSFTGCGQTAGTTGITPVSAITTDTAAAQTVVTSTVTNQTQTSVTSTITTKTTPATAKTTATVTGSTTPAISPIPGHTIAVQDAKNLQFCKEIYLDYNGLIWRMTAKCDQDMADQVKADFDHILQTFKLLD